MTGANDCANIKALTGLGRLGVLGVVNWRGKLSNVRDRNRNLSQIQRQLLDFYYELPFEKHPLWMGIKEHELTLSQIFKAETQHFLRSKRGQSLRRKSADDCEPKSGLIYQGALDNYLEEVVPDGSGPSHLDLIVRLLVDGGVTHEELAEAEPTPGNAAAMALYEDIAGRGTACHLIGAGLVEFYYSRLAPEIYDAYTRHYGMTAHLRP